MANGKAEITEVNLGNISVNLSDYLSDIRQYDGFIQCNSPWIGGLVNNVYKKNLRIQDGHKFVRLHNGDLYTLFGGTLYKNYTKIATLKTGYFYKEAYKDSYITESDTEVIVRYGTQEVRFEKHLDYSYDYVEENSTLYVSIAPTFSTNVTNFLAATRMYIINANGVTVKEGADASFIFSQHKELVSLTGATAVQYDPAGVIIDTDSTITTVYLNESGSLIKNTVDKVLHDGTHNYWTRGEKLKTASGFTVLYYNKFVSGIGYGNSVITYDVDRIIRVGEDYIAYEDPSGNKWKLFISGSEYPEFTVDDEFIYFNTLSYENTYSFATGEMFCRSDDYNDRLLVRGTSSGKGLWATGYRSNAIEYNYYNFASIYPQVVHNLGDSFATFLVDDNKHPVEIFAPNVAGGVAQYQGTLIFPNQLTYTVHNDVTLVGTNFAINADYNTLYNTPVLMEIHDTYINEKIGTVDNHSYILSKSQRQENILGYYELTLSEIKDIFLVQGSFYGLNDKFIFSISVNNSMLSIDRVAANKLDLEFLGAFPQYALFYSRLDKSLYAFTGDATIQKIKECYRINKIKATYCDPSRLTMIISTDIGTLIVYQNQMILIDDMFPEGQIFYDNNVYVVGEYLLSFREEDGYKCMPVKLQTEFYGIGSNIKSVNDCVYIRIAKNNLDKGYIKFKAFTLNEVSKETNEKVYEFSSDKFDKITGSMAIRYQPGLQSGSGFSVKIESSNPIISMAIGHTPEAVQNSKINL